MAKLLFKQIPRKINISQIKIVKINQNKIINHNYLRKSSHLLLNSLFLEQKVRSTSQFFISECSKANKAYKNEKNDYIPFSIWKMIRVVVKNFFFKQNNLK